MAFVTRGGGLAYNTPGNKPPQAQPGWASWLQSPAAKQREQQAKYPFGAGTPGQQFPAYRPPQPQSLLPSAGAASPFPPVSAPVAAGPTPAQVGTGGSFYNANTAITPRMPYSQDQINQNYGRNVATAWQDAATAGRPQALAGFSAGSPAFQRMSGTNAGQAFASGLGEAEQQRYGMDAANADAMLAGQTAQRGDWLGQMGNVASFNAANQGYARNAQSGLLNAMQAGLGAIGNVAEQRYTMGKADADNMLASQMGRSADWLGQMGNASQFNSANQNYQLGNQQGLFNAMQAGVAAQGIVPGAYAQTSPFWAANDLGYQQLQQGDLLNLLGLVNSMY